MEVGSKAPRDTLFYPVSSAEVLESGRMTPSGLQFVPPGACHGQPHPRPADDSSRSTANRPAFPASHHPPLRSPGAPSNPSVGNLARTSGDIRNHIRQGRDWTGSRWPLYIGRSRFRPLKSIRRAALEKNMNFFRAGGRSGHRSGLRSRLACSLVRLSRPENPAAHPPNKHFQCDFA